MNRQQAASRPRIRTDLPSDLRWYADAACAGRDEDKGAPIMFPVGHPGAGEVHPADEGKAICSTCPVKKPCLDYALTKPERYGIWGGMTEHERDRLLRQRRDTGR